MERHQETVTTWINEEHHPAIGATAAQPDSANTTDTTERKRLEDQLRESESRFRTMFEQAAVGIAYTRLDGQLLEVNQRFCDILGYTREELLERTFWDITHPDDVGANAAYLQRLLAGEPQSSALEKRYIRKEGSVAWVQVTVSLMLEPPDKPRSYMSVIEDITKRKRVEEERAQLLAREREERARAEAATRRLEALHAMTDTALAHLGLNDLLRELLSRIHQVMAVDNVAVLLTTEDSQYLTMRAAFGPEEEVAGQVRVPFGRGFAGTIAARSEPLIVEDLSTIEIMTPLLREKLRSLLGVPLMIEGRVIGVMHIGTMSSRRFTEDDAQLLQRIADRVAPAIAQSRLYEAEQRARKEARNSLNALLAMAEELVLVPDEDDSAEEHAMSGMNEVAQRLAELACNMLGCKRIAITTVEPETKEPRAVAVVGISPEQEQKWRNRETGFVLGNMFVDPAYTSRLQANEVLVLDMTQPPFRDYPNPYGIRLMLLAPMSIGNQLVGFMAVDHAGAEHKYTSEEKAMASAVAKLAALVIERARLLRERAEAHATELALRDANRRMDEFLGIASHELRTPLTTIKANVQLAERQLQKVGADLSPSPSPDIAQLAHRLAVVRDLLARADQQSEVLNRLVGDLLNVSRIQANKLALHVRPEPCNLLRIVQQAVQEQRKVAPKRSILLDLSPEEMVPVMADPDRIGQVVLNYLANALKYSSPDRPIEVSLQVEGQLARVSVQDEGPGLPASEQEHIWERFYRVPGIEVESGSGVGLGLGLYISKVIIERHHGQVGVQRAPGKGSTFWFTMPLARTSSIASV